jgi:peptidoglycan DL-endopeptidase LytE
VKKGDSLSALSVRVGLSVEEIKRLNGLRTNQLRPGQALVLATPQRATDDSDEELGDAEREGASAEVSEKEEGEKPEASEEAAKWKNENERSLFVRLVKTFLGVPYRLGGSTLKGLDCSAFVKRIYEVFNVQLPRTTWEQIRFGKRVNKEELAEGDLVFFRIPTRRASNRHVGIYIGNNEFVHASSRNREVRVDNLETPYFSKRFLNGVRVKEFEEEL